MQKQKRAMRRTKPGEWEGLDTHRWTLEEKVCEVCTNPGSTPKPDKPVKHFMKCSMCGVRRHGAFAEQGAYHYFMYDQPSLGGYVRELIHEVIPPCSRKVRRDLGVLDEVKICVVCRHIFENGKCRYGDDAGYIKLPFIRSLKVPA